MKLRESDHKLLAYLFHNARAPVSEIAKATKLSRDQVNYKINKFISEGIIKKFATLFNSSKLGHDYHVGLFLKLNKYPSVNSCEPAVALLNLERVIS